MDFKFHGWYVHGSPLDGVAENVFVLCYEVGERRLKFPSLPSWSLFSLLVFILEMSMSFCPSSYAPPSSNSSISLKCSPCSACISSSGSFYVGVSKLYVIELISANSVAISPV